MNILENDIVKINRLAEAAASVISEAPVLTEAEKPLAKDEMRLEVDDRGRGSLDSGLFPQKGKGNVFNDIMSDGPMAFLQSVILSSDYRKVDQMEKAIAKLEKEGLYNEYTDEKIDAEEQAYVPKSLKIKKDGGFTVYTFKLKPKFTKNVVMKNIFAPDLN